MRTFEFAVTIHASSPAEDMAAPGGKFDAITELVFERFGGDVVPAYIDSTVVLECIIEAWSLNSAVRSVLGPLGEIMGDPVPFGSNQFFKSAPAERPSPLSLIGVEVSGEQYAYA